MTVISATASGEVGQALLPHELADGGDVLTGGTSFLDHRQEFVEIPAGARVEVDVGDGRSRAVRAAVRVESRPAPPFLMWIRTGAP